LNAALRRLNRWVRKGKVSGGPFSPRLEVSPAPPEIVRDARGNALGGIRTPQVDVPIATLSGLGQSGGGFCGLFGTTVPFDAATLAALYPTHDAYVKAIVRSARQASRAGFITRIDTTAIKAAAMESNVGGLPACRASSTFVGCSSAFGTRAQCFFTTPSGPIQTVERMTPVTFLPYIVFSPYAP
jgi:hypothetical protein